MVAAVSPVLSTIVLSDIFGCTGDCGGDRSDDSIDKEFGIESQCLGTENCGCEQSGNICEPFEAR